MASINDIKGPKQLIGFLVDEIVHGDCYCLKKIENKNFDYIIDIGANIGMFDLVCQEFMKPNKLLIAVEPVKSTFDILMENLKFVPNSVGIQKGIGDGKPLYVKFSPDCDVNPGSNRCTEEESSGEKIETITFKNIFEDLNIPKDSRYLIKFDCEGGEKYFNHPDNWEYLINAAVITGEIHFNIPETFSGNEIPDKPFLEDMFKRLSEYMDIKDLNWITKFPNGFISYTGGNIFAVKKG